MRSKVSCTNVINDAKKFTIDIELEQNNLKITRENAIKIISGEKALHEISSSPSEKCGIKMYYVVSDKIINSIEI